MKILVVDDHPLVRDAIATILKDLTPALTVLEAGDAATGLFLAREHPDLDLVLLDLNLPGVRDFDALDALRREQPAMPVVILSMFQDRKTVQGAIQRGAMGFIPKASSKQVILQAARLVLAGGVCLPPETLSDTQASTAARPFEPPGAGVHAAGELRLTARQRQVLALIMRGESNKQICRALGLAERTVKVHVTAVLTALKVASRTQAVVAAGRLGLREEDLLVGLG